MSKNKKLSRLITNIIYAFLKPALKAYLKDRITTRVLIIKNNQILVIRNTISNGDMSLPGGGVKNGEEPSAALIREVNEEVGIKLNNDKLIYQGIYWASNDGLKYQYHLWFYNLKTDPVIKKRPFEISEAYFIDERELMNLRLSSELSHSLKNWQTKSNLIK